MIQSLLTFDERNNLRSLSSSRLITIVNDEIEDVGYKLSFEERLCCHHSSWLFTHWYFVAKRFLTILVQSIKRRLHL